MELGLAAAESGGTTHGARGEPGPWAHRVVMARAPAKGETAGTSEQLCSDLQADEEAGLAGGEGRATRAVWTRAVKAPRAEPGHRSSGKRERMKGEPHPANAPRTGRTWRGGARTARGDPRTGCNCSKSRNQHTGHSGQTGQAEGQDERTRGGNGGKGHRLHLAAHLGPAGPCSTPGTGKL